MIGIVPNPTPAPAAPVLKRRPAFSLVEVLLAAVLISIMLGWVGFKSRQLGRTEIADAAVTMALEFDRVIAEAVASGGQAVIWLNGPSDQWAAWSTEAEDMFHVPTAGLRTAVGDRMGFGYGEAAYGPYGDPTSDSPGGIPLSLISCDAWGRCALDGERTVTIYLQHEDRADLVAAITVTISGAAEAWLYDASNGSWE